MTIEHPRTECDWSEPNILSPWAYLKCLWLIGLLRIGKRLGWRWLIWNAGVRLYWYPSYPRGVPEADHG